MARQEIDWEQMRAAELEAMLQVLTDAQRAEFEELRRRLRVIGDEWDAAAACVVYDAVSEALHELINKALERQEAEESPLSDSIKG